MPPPTDEELAERLGKYFTLLLRKGFKREEALHITVSFQETLLALGIKDDEGDE